MKTVVVLCAAVAVAAVVGIASKSDPSSGSPVTPAAPPATLDDARGSAEAANSPPSGEVREAIDVAGYTYLRLLSPQGHEFWAAVSKASVKVGSTVTIADAARMTNFESATLKRTFDVIYFGNLEQALPVAGPAGALPPGHPPISGQGAGTPTLPGAHALPSTAPPSSAISVQPAAGPNGRTIAALLAEVATIAGKAVKVRGQVVKATPVQGVTYYRLRDGSVAGSEPAELVVSSTAPAQVGDVVTFEGPASVNVDVGIGYKYPLMLQNASRVGD
jgi:hypothetical protein